MAWYQRLIRLRRTLPDIRDAALGEGAVARMGDLLLVRRGALNLLANLGTTPGTLSVAADAEQLATFGEASVHSDGRVELGPGSVVLLLAPPPTETFAAIRD